MPLAQKLGLTHNEQTRTTVFFVDLHSFSNSDLQGCMFGTCHAASRQPKVKDYIFPDTSRELATWPAPPRLTKALDCSRKPTQGCWVVKCYLTEENDAFKLLGRLDESKFTFPTVKASAQERDTRKAGLRR